MSKTRVIINFELISKKLNHSLTSDEEELFSNWLNEDPSHKSYFESAQRYHLNNPELYIDTKKAWNSVKKEIKYRPKNLSLLVSISAAAIILIFISVLPLGKNSENTSVSQVTTIKHGSKQATLILDDGSVLDLSTPKNLQMTEGASDIRIAGTEIKYSGKSIITTEIKYNTLSVPRGGEFFLQLADGSKVWLNSETTIRYPVVFHGKERRVVLTGEAFFEVNKNEEVPFIVESDNQEIKVLGTEFNISAYKEDPFISTTLVKGSVKVSIKDHPEVSQMLIPNEQSYTSRIGTQIQKQTVDPYKYIAWKDGRFVFEDQNLYSIMQTLSKWYDVDIVFTSDELKNLRFTGNLPRYSDFNEILNKIGKTNEVKFRIENRRIIVG